MGILSVSRIFVVFVVSGMVLCISLVAVVSLFFRFTAANTSVMFFLSTVVTGNDNRRADSMSLSFSSARIKLDSSDFHVVLTRVSSFFHANVLRPLSC